EGKQFTPEELQTIVPALMEAADGETDAVARESIFNALSSASMAYPGAEIDWSPIADSLAGLTPDCLEHALLALGFSGHSIYRARIEPYLNPPKKTIRETAAEALSPLEHLSASKSGRGVKANRRDQTAKR